MTSASRSKPRRLAPWGVPSTRHLAAVLVLLFLLARSHAQTPHPLHNNQPADLHGTLQLHHVGWKQFLILRLPTPYTLDPGSPDTPASTPAPPPAPVNEIGLTLPGQDDVLARSIGKPIRVSGRLQIAPGNPCCWNGTLLWADTVALPGGVYLSGKLPEPGLPLSIHRYTATYSMRADSWVRTYTARDLETRRPLAQPNLAGCSVTGAGDALTCFCSDGFRPTAGSLRPAGTLTAETQSPTLTDHVAQFPLGPPTTPVTAEIECARRTPKDDASHAPAPE